MANYNHGRFLLESLPAILGQEYDALEVIVVDDGSTDESVSILEGFAKASPVFRFLKNDRNRGVIYSATRALEEASGKYIAFCAADDRLLPGFVRDSVAALEAHPQAAACSALVRIMDESGRDQGIFHPLVVSRKACFISPARATEIFRRHGTWYMGPAALFKRQAYVEAGGFDVRLGPMSDDVTFMVLALKHGVCHIPRPLAVWRRMEGTFSQATSANLKVKKAIIDHACRTMRTAHAGLFPEDLIARCEGRWRFAAGATLWTRWASGMKAKADAGRESAGFVGRVAASMLGAAGFACRILSSAYLFARHRPFDVASVLSRRARRAV